MAAEVVIKHIAACREIPFLKYALPVITPESNLPQAALQLQRVLKHDYQLKCQFMTEDGKNRPGSFTTHENKLEMVRILKEVYMKPNRIVFYENFIVAVSENEDCTAGLSVKKEFERQLRDFRRIKKYKTHKDGSAYCEFYYHGKHDNANDDLIMTLLIDVLMYKRFIEKPKYAGLRAK